MADEKERKDEEDILSPRTSKKQMTKALTSLITTFKDEAEEQDEILTQIQMDAANNPNFGNKSNALQWTVNEVCHWLTTIDLQTHCHKFIECNINGNVLLNDINKHTLSTSLHIESSIDCNKILHEIEALKHYKPPSSTTNIENNKTEILPMSEMIASIKKENESLQIALNEDQKSMNQINEILKSQNAMIQSLALQLTALQTNNDKKIKQLQKKNKDLTDGYIEIEDHYQNQLKDSMQKSVDLEAQMSENHQSENGQIGLLWSENENATKQLANEREKRSLLEASYKNIEFRLNAEIQKRQLLESQTRRLTAELTKYLDKESMENEEQIIKYQRKASMNTKAGWLKFLSSTKTKKTFKLHKKLPSLSMNNIKEKMKKPKEKNEESKKEKIEKPKHVKRATLGENVLKTFKKIQNAATPKKKKEKKESDNVQMDMAMDEIDIDLNDEHSVDEDSSAEEAEKQRKHMIVITTAEDKNGQYSDSEDDEDSDSSAMGQQEVIDGGGDYIGHMEIYRPSLTVLPQDIELSYTDDPDG